MLGLNTRLSLPSCGDCKCAPPNPASFAFLLKNNSHPVSTLWGEILQSTVILKYALARWQDGCYVAEGRDAQRGQHLPSKIMKPTAGTAKARDHVSLPDLGISGTQPDGFGAMGFRVLERIPLCEALNKG